MANTSQKMTIYLDGNARGATTAVQTLSTSFSGLGKQLLGLAGIGGGFALVTKGLQAIEQGFQKSIQFIKESTEEAGRAEAALVKLNTALESSGEYTDENTKALQDYAESLQRVTAFEDDEIIASEARLAMFGLTTDEIKIATQATLDLAAATGMDLNAATVLMGKAMVGETGMLKRYGIIIDENKIATEGWSAVIDAVTEKFGGQAAAAGETYLGTIERIKNNIGNLKEEIGNAFLPFLKNLTNTFTDNLPGIQKKIENLAKKISEFLNALMGANWSSVITSIKNLGGTLNILITGNSSFTTAEEKAQNFADTLSKVVDLVARLAIGMKLLSEAVILSWRSFDLFGQDFSTGFVERLQTDWRAWLETFRRGISETDLLINGFQDTSDSFMAGLAASIQPTKDLDTAISGLGANVDIAGEETNDLTKKLDLLSPAEVTAEDKTKKLKETMAQLDKVTLGAVSQAIALKKAIDNLESKTVYITTFYNDVMGGTPGRIAAAGKQLGGMGRNNQYITDLSLPMIGGEALIPRELTKAIKEGRTSFAGVRPDAQGQGVIINVAVTGNNISSELDIDIIAEKLADKVKSTQRGAGMRW